MGDTPKPLSGQLQGPLKGLRVVDVSINILGPIATQTLGDMGAEVIKVETRSGDPNRYMPDAVNHGMAPMYMTANRSKKSVVLDLRDPEGLEALMRLVDTADVFVHSMRQAGAERLGIGYEAIRARKPDIIYAYGMGYGPNGPYAARPAYDDVIQGESGLVDLQFKATGEYRYFPTIMVDKVCGLTLCNAIAMALVHRFRTGEGQMVAVPMFETAVAFNLLEHFWAGSFRREGPWYYPRLLSPMRRPLKTQDGQLCFLATHDEEWRRVWRAMGKPEMADDARFRTLALRTRNIEVLYGLFEAELATMSTREAVRRLRDEGVACSLVNAYADLQDDEHLKASGFFQTYAHPTEGPTTTTSIPTILSRTPGHIAFAPPNLGEHSASILAEVGYSTEQIARLSRTEPLPVPTRPQAESPDPLN